MMDDFLSAILPRTGVYFAAVQNPNGGLIHHGHHTIQDLVKFIEDTDQSGRTVFHACAAYQQESYKDEKGATRYRTKDNVRALRTFFIDLDVKKQGQQAKGTEYETKEDAYKAILKFLKTEQFIPPIVLDSGGGYHCYWAFEDEMLRGTWEPLAEGFKDALTKAGFKIDPAVCDASRILRPPGSHNRKTDTPREVRVLSKLYVYPNEVVIEALNKLTKKYKVTPDLLKQAARKFDASKVTNLYAHESYPSSYITDVASRCAVVSEMRETQGNVSQTIWYGVLGLMGHAEDGESLIQDWSKGHKDYSASETTSEFNRWKEGGFGPATCEYFRAKGESKHCATCANWGRITTPLQLGIRIVQAEEEDAMGNEIVPPPKPFVRAKDGIYYIVDASANIKRKIFSSDLYISDIMQQNGFEVALFNYNRPHMGWQQFHERTSTFNKLDSAWGFFSDRGIYITNKGDAEVMSQYCRGYLEELHQRKRALATYSNMGWKGNEFVVGDTIVTAEGFQQNKAIRQSIPISEYFPPKGSIQPWAEATEIYRSPELYGHGFALLMGFAAPLMKFTGLGGAVVNLVGDTGRGKSTVQRAILSVYGDPERLLLKATDTHNAVMRRVGILNNLPVCIDEMGGISKERASNLIIQSSQGMDKLSLSQNRDERPAMEWSTIFTMSSNHPMLAKLQDMKHDFSAESMRLLEMKVKRSAFFSSLENGKMLNRCVQENYGKMGLVYLRRLCQMQDTIQAELDAAQVELARHEIVFSAQERYWNAVFCTAYVGGKIAKEMGLLRYNFMHSIRHAYNLIIDYKAQLSEVEMDAFRIISEFIAENYSQFIIVENRGLNNMMSLTSSGIREVCGRIETNPATKTQYCSIVITALRQWLQKKYLTVNEIKDSMMLSNAIVKDSASIQLGKGTHFKIPPVKCIVFNLNDPGFKSSLDLDDLQQEAELQNG